MKPYPKYKDSGVEWIGEVPEGWEVKKLKYSNKVIIGLKNIRFSEAVAGAEIFGFRVDRINGSHHIFAHPDVQKTVTGSRFRVGGYLTVEPVNREPDR